jgi:hypothetical protein
MRSFAKKEVDETLKKQRAGSSFDVYSLMTSKAPAKIVIYSLGPDTFGEHASRYVTRASVSLYREPGMKLMSDCCLRFDYDL